VRLLDSRASAIISGPIIEPTQDPIWVSEPVAIAMDFPHLEGVQIGALMEPFRPATLSFGDEAIVTDSPLRVGALSSELFRSPIGVWDHVTDFEIWMPGAQLVARPTSDILSGGNRFAVETTAGWEIIAAADIVLTGAETYRLKTLLRGLSGSDDAQLDRVPAGARIIALDTGVESLPLSNDYVGQRVEITIDAGGRAGVPIDHSYSAEHLRPLSPVHLRIYVVDGLTRLSWIPRQRDGGEKSMKRRSSV